MQQILVSIYDKKAAMFHPCFCIQNKALAIRAFGDAVNSKQPSDLSNHPQDFSLFYVGDYDQESGSVSAVSPVEIATGLDFVSKGA